MNMVSPRISHTASRFLAPLSRSDQPVYMLTTASWTAFDVGNIMPSWYMYIFLDMSLGLSVDPGKPYSTIKVPSLRTRPNSTSFLRLFLSFRSACGGKNTNGFSTCIVTHNIVHSYYWLGCNFSAKSWILTVEVKNNAKTKDRLRNTHLNWIWQEDPIHYRLEGNASGGDRVLLYYQVVDVSCLHTVLEFSRVGLGATQQLPKLCGPERMRGSF